MGMLMHNTLMEMEKNRKREDKAEKPAEVPAENNSETEPVKKAGGRRKTSK